MEKYGKIGIEDVHRFAGPCAWMGLINMALPQKNAWAPFSNYTLQLHMDFHGFKWCNKFLRM